MQWMVKYQADDGLREIYFETEEEAHEWASSHTGSEMWKCVRSYK